MLLLKGARVALVGGFVLLLVPVSLGVDTYLASQTYRQISTGPCSTSPSSSTQALKTILHYLTV